MKKIVLTFVLLIAITSNAQKLIPYNDGEQKLEGVLYNPTKSNGNAVLLLPALERN